MNGTLQSKDTTSRYEFKIEHDGKTYKVIIFTNSKGKFIDDEIELVGGPMEVNDEVRDSIIDYLDKEWDALVKE